MATFILDTNVLIRNPEVLAKAGPLTRFIIPAAVIRELERSTPQGTQRHRLIDLVRDVERKGFVEIAKDGSELDTLGGRQLPGDLIIAMLMSEAKRKGEDITVATEDKDVLSAASKLDIPVVDTSVLSARIASIEAKGDPAVLTKVRALVGAERRQLVTGVLVGVVASLLANLVGSSLGAIVATINIWGTLLGLMAAASVAYWFRGRYRLVYGTAELGIGFSTSARVFWPKFDYGAVTATDIFQMAAGLYIMVRGFDNIGRALKSTRWEAVWRRFSGD